MRPPRLKLRDLLLGVLVYLDIRNVDGDGHLYYQPPETVRMKYPAVIYSLSGMPAQHADNQPYLVRNRYLVTGIDKDPDSRLPEELAKLPGCRFDRFYTADNLNHWAFTITM